MATRSPLLTPPSSFACQAVGSTSDSSTTFLSGMPSGIFRQFRSAAVVRPASYPMHWILCFAASQAARTAEDAQAHGITTCQVTNPPGAHGSSHTQQGEFAGGAYHMERVRTEPGRLGSRRSDGSSLHVHKGSSCQPASCTYSSSLGQLITLSNTLQFSVMLHGKMLTGQRHQKSVGTQA